MKKTLIWAGTVIGTAAFLTLTLSYIGETKKENRTIVTSGECITSAPKDRTAISLRIKTLDKSAAVSMKLATIKASEITDFLKTQNVKMQTTSFDSYEKTEWDQATQKPINLGVETNIMIDISAEKLEYIELVLNKFSGTDNVYTENFRMFSSAEILKPILENCLSGATENARARAVAIANGDKAKVGKMISAQFSDNANIERPMMNFARGKVLSEDSNLAGGLVSKDTEITVKVVAEFEVK